MTPFILLFGLMTAAYLLGAVPWGLLLTRRAAGRDVRTLGSGNIGATNVARVAGGVLGALTLLLDMIKGGGPVFLAWSLSPATVAPIPPDLVVSVTGLCAVIGHMYPVYLKFKTGGKGVATAAGCFLVISPGACAAAGLVFLLVFFLSRRVSPASLSATALLPGFIALWGGSVFVIMTAGVVAVLIFIRHSANIRRLINGTEPVYRLSRSL